MCVFKGACTVTYVHAYMSSKACKNVDMYTVATNMERGYCLMMTRGMYDVAWHAILNKVAFP